MHYKQLTVDGAPLENRRTKLYWMCMLLIVCACVEGGSFICLRLLRVKGVPGVTAKGLTARERTILLRFADDDPATFFAYSQTLGWVHRPSAMRREEREIINAQGLRAKREFPATSPEQLRIAAFGDSFTYGDEVSNAETWEEQIMLREPAWTVLNAGVAGYGVDQAMLRYKKMASVLTPHVVLIGFMTENINRSVNTYRPFLDRGSSMISKPRFVLYGDHLKLIPNPMQRLDDLRALANDETNSMLAKAGEHDYFYQKRFYVERLWDVLPSVHLTRVAVSQIREQLLDEPITRGGQYNTRSEAFQVTKAILQQFYRDVLRNRAVPLIILFPDRATIEAYRRNGYSIYEPLKDDLKRDAFETIDLLDALNEVSTIAPVFGRYHYSTVGNRIVAQKITSYFRERRLDDPNVRGNILLREQRRLLPDV